jgi:oxygen-independent coproporphyrinogen-3 oxidase
LSLGIQSFQPEALKWLRRLHGPREALRAVRQARKAGLDNINVDLIFGLPGILERSWRDDLEAVLALEIPHVSVYGLSVEEGTPLAAAIAEGRVSGPEDHVFREEFLEAHRILTAEGYRHYEVSHFALPGFEARHNLACWSRSPYLGLGNSAHTFQGHRRRWNLRSWHAYQSACLEGRRPWESEELLTAADVRLERIWLGLRTEGGLPLEQLGRSARSLGEDWEEEGLAVIGPRSLRLTPRGWLVLDRLTVALDRAEGESGA